MTTADYDFFRGREIKYAPAIEIVDADEPWPPRWFALHPSDTDTGFVTSRSIILNAGMQHDKLLFFTVISIGGHRNNLAILSCDEKMQFVDTFFQLGREFDSHDFKLSTNGDMMYMPTHNIKMDLRKPFKNLSDSSVRMIYETIQIDDAKGKTIFSWDPLEKLGFDASYLPYRFAPGVMSGHTSFEWSHGNSVSYDFDGNILYSFKHIGIGKISRSDGHLIWHIERMKLKANELSDSIPIYLQHDLQAITDKKGNVSYTVVSNGDEDHPECLVYNFSVSYNSDSTPIFKVLKKISPPDKIPNSGGGGNYDAEPDGSYLFNYGLFRQDTTHSERPLFEYRNAKNHQTGTYSISPTIFCYRIHKISAWRPERPVIRTSGSQLISSNKSTSQKWYRLSGPKLETVEFLAKGENYSPQEKGYYCVATRYGIGWSVSRSFYFEQK